jgi:NADH-quinone oxidoreductase subunit N
MREFIPDIRYWVLAPQLLLTVLALAVLLVGLYTDRARKSKLEHYLPPDYLAGFGLLAVLAWATALLVQSLQVGPAARGIALFPLDPNNAFSPSLLMVDRFAMFFGIVAIAGSIIVVALSIDYFRNKSFNRGEYYALLIFATLAITLVAMSTDLITIYLSLEFLSLCSYVLAAYLKSDRKSSEAGIKYFLFGAVASAVMLYGMSMLYGITGTTSLSGIATGLSMAGSLSKAAWLAVVFVLVGLGFKLAMVPFHLWAPDTYEGAPTPITAFLSVCSKAAGLAVIVRFLGLGVPLPSGAFSGVDWFSLLILLSAVTMTLGNLVAISQRNIKRMLAYSSIAQVGYMLIGLLAAKGSDMGLPGLMIYLFAYLFMNLGAFAVVIGVSDKTGDDEISSYAGLMARSPFYAFTLTIFMLSLAGIPPTVGFFGKFYVFGSGIQFGQRLWPLVGLGLANTVISVYYYFNVVRHMFFMPATNDEKIVPSNALAIALLVALIGTLAFGIYPEPLINLARWCSVSF